MKYANYEIQLLRKLSKKIIYFLSSTLIIILFNFDFDFYTVQFGNIFLFFYFILFCLYCFYIFTNNNFYIHNS